MTSRKYICAGCRSEIAGEHIKCTVTGCNEVYDLACSCAENLRPDEINAWTCPECKSKTRKSDNTSTPVRGIQQASQDNITHRKKTTVDKRALASDDGVDSLRALTEQIKAMRKDLDTIKTDLSKRLDDFASKFLESVNRINVLESNQYKIEARNSDLEIKLSEIEERLAQMSRQALKNDIEILGIQETKGENPVSLVLVAARKVGVELNASDIDDATRVGPKNNSEDPNKSASSLPRPLVVRFTRKATRDNFLKTAKTKRSLTSEDLAPGGPIRTVYVNERLTAEHRRLFREAKRCAGEHGYKFCWISNGCIYVKRKEGVPGKRIACYKDLLTMSPATSYG